MRNEKNINQNQTNLQTCPLSNSLKAKALTTILKAMIFNFFKRTRNNIFPTTMMFFKLNIYLFLNILEVRSMFFENYYYEALKM